LGDCAVVQEVASLEVVETIDEQIALSGVSKRVCRNEIIDECPNDDLPVDLGEACLRSFCLWHTASRIDLREQGLALEV
jgi:hypothetical protein